MIDWENLAKINGMTPDEFEKEVLMAASALGAKRIDAGLPNDADTLKFSCADNKGKIALYVRRVGNIT